MIWNKRTKVTALTQNHAIPTLHNHFINWVWVIQVLRNRSWQRSNTIVLLRQKTTFKGTSLDHNMITENLFKTTTKIKNIVGEGADNHRLIICFSIEWWQPRIQKKAPQLYTQLIQIEAKYRLRPFLNPNMQIKFTHPIKENNLWISQIWK